MEITTLVFTFAVVGIATNETIDAIAKMAKNEHAKR